MTWGPTDKLRLHEKFDVLFDVGDFVHIFCWLKGKTDLVKSKQNVLNEYAPRKR